MTAETSIHYDFRPPLRLAWVSSLCSDSLDPSSRATRLLLPEMTKRCDCELFLDGRSLANPETTAWAAPLVAKNIYHAIRLLERDFHLQFDAIVVQVTSSQPNDFAFHASCSLPAYVVLHDLKVMDNSQLFPMWDKSVALLNDEHSVAVMRNRAPNVPSLLLPFPVATYQRRSVIKGSSRIVITGSKPVAHRLHAILEGLSLAAKALRDSGDETPEVIWVLGSESELAAAQEFVRREHFSAIADSLSIEMLLCSTFEERQKTFSECDLHVSFECEPLACLPYAVLEGFGCSLATIVAQRGPTSSLPASVALKCPVDQNTAAFVKAAVLELVREPAVRRSLGEAAQQYITEVHAPQCVVEDLLSALRSTRKYYSAAITSRRQALLQARANWRMESLASPKEISA